MSDFGKIVDESMMIQMTMLVPRSVIELAIGKEMSTHTPLIGTRAEGNRLGRYISLELVHQYGVSHAGELLSRAKGQPGIILR